MRSSPGLPRSSTCYSAHRSQLVVFRNQGKVLERPTLVPWKLSSIQPPVKATSDVAERSTTATRDTGAAEKIVEDSQQENVVGVQNAGTVTAEKNVGDSQQENVVGVQTADTVAAEKTVGDSQQEEVIGVQTAESRQPDQPSTSQSSTQGVLKVASQKRAARKDKNSEQRNKKQQKPQKPLALADFPYKVGDKVLGKVIREDARSGWRVEFVDEPSIIGLCPAAFKPFTLRDSLEDFTLPPGGMGLVRMFKIERIPDNMFYYGRGPVVNAMTVDLEVMWRRAEQVRLVHEERIDTLAVNLRSTSNAGILGVWDGLPLFIPWKFACHYDQRLSEGDKEATAQQEMAKSKSYVRIVDVNPSKNRFVGSLVDARQTRALEGVQIGDLMTGFVVKVVEYGCFIRVLNMQVKGLLHIRNISCSRVYDLTKVFRAGDPISAFLIDVDEKNQVEFSTLELETYIGEMLENPQGCMQNAASKGPFQELHEKVREMKANSARQERIFRQRDDRLPDWRHGKSPDGGPGDGGGAWRSMDEDSPRNGFAQMQAGRPGQRKAEDLEW